MLVEYILGLGFEDIADFAYAYADASDLSKLLDGVPPETWTSMGVTDPEHSIPAARIRRAFVMAGSARATGVARNRMGRTSAPQAEPRSRAGLIPASFWGQTACLAFAY